MEHGLVVMEVALAMLIVAGAALLTRSVSKLYDIDPGFEPSGVAATIVLAGAEVGAAENQQKITEITQAIAALPGVQSAGATRTPPLRCRCNSFGLTIAGRESEPSTYTYFRVGTTDYFRTMGMKLKSGRFFDSSDHPDSSGGTVIINEAFAKKYFPGEDPIGKRIGGGLPGSWRIVGVLGNVAEAHLTDDREPVRYYPAAVGTWFGQSTTFVARASAPGAEAALLDGMRRAINRVAPGYAVQQGTTMSRLFDNAVGPARQVRSLLSMLSALALILGAIGIYGVISHFAARRKRDWAIRVALGLPAWRVVRQIVVQGAALVLVGIAFGAVGTAALSRLLTSFLYGISNVDVVAFAAAAALLLIVGVLAALVPALRAGSVDPALVLREQ